MCFGVYNGFFIFLVKKKTDFWSPVVIITPGTEATIICGRMWELMSLLAINLGNYWYLNKNMIIYRYDMIFF